MLKRSLYTVHAAGRWCHARSENGHTVFISFHYFSPPFFAIEIVWLFSYCCSLAVVAFMQINRILLGNNYDAALAIILKFHSKYNTTTQRLEVTWGAEKKKSSFAFLHRVRMPAIQLLPTAGRPPATNKRCVQMHFKCRDGKK